MMRGRKGIGLINNPKTDRHRRIYPLCSATESRFVQALDDDTLTPVLVDGLFFVKEIGKQTGLALYTVILPDGQIIKEGTFYSLVYARDRHKVRSAADRGATRIALGGTWTEMREAEPRDLDIDHGDYIEPGEHIEPSELLERARQAAMMLPDYNYSPERREKRHELGHAVSSTEQELRRRTGKDGQLIRTLEERRRPLATLAQQERATGRYFR